MYSFKKSCGTVGELKNALKNMHADAAINPVTVEYKVTKQKGITTGRISIEQAK